MNKTPSISAATHQAPATEESPRLPAAAHKAVVLWKDNIPTSLTQNDRTLFQKIRSLISSANAVQPSSSITEEREKSPELTPVFEDPFLGLFQTTLITFLQTAIKAELSKPRDELLTHTFELAMKMIEGVDDDVVEIFGWKDLDPCHPEHIKLIDTLLDYFSKDKTEGEKQELVKQALLPRNDLDSSKLLPLSAENLVNTLQLSPNDAKRTLNKILTNLLQSGSDVFKARFAKIFSQMVIDQFQPAQTNQTTVWMDFLLRLLQVASFPIVHHTLEIVRKISFKNIFDNGAAIVNQHLTAVIESYQTAKTAAKTIKDQNVLYRIFETTFRKQSGCHPITRDMITSLHEAPIKKEASSEKGPSEQSPKLSPIRAPFYKKLSEILTQHLASPHIRKQILDHIFANKDSLLEIGNQDPIIKALLGVLFKDYQSGQFLFEVLWDHFETDVIRLVERKLQEWLTERLATPDEFAVLLYSEIIPELTDTLEQKLCTDILANSIQMDSADNPNKLLSLVFELTSRPDDNDDITRRLALELQKSLQKAAICSKELLGLTDDPTVASPLVQKAMREFKIEIKNTNLPISTPANLLNSVKSYYSLTKTEVIPDYAKLIANLLSLAKLSTLEQIFKPILDWDVIQKPFSEALVSALTKVRTPLAYRTLFTPLMRKLNSFNTPDGIKSLSQPRLPLPEEKERDYLLQNEWEKISRITYDHIILLVSDSTAKTLAVKAAMGTDHTKLETAFFAVYKKLLNDQLLNENLIYLLMDLIKDHFDRTAKELSTNL